MLGYEVYTGGGADSSAEALGADATADSPADDDVDQSTFEIVMRLLAPFRQRSHIVYTDRFFSSIPLFLHMLKEGILRYRHRHRHSTTLDGHASR